MKIANKYPICKKHKGDSKHCLSRCRFNPNVTKEKDCPYVEKKKLVKKHKE